MANIGVFDSGVGGLWILKHLKDALPDNNYIFFGDEGHVPYGTRTLEEIRDFSILITEFLISKKCNIIVIACNTASAASLKYLREKFPHVIFVGMEPAVKPAVEITHTKKVGILATRATFQGELYNSVVERFAHDVDIFRSTCPGLVEQIEKGDLDSDITKNILREAILPMVKDGIDTVVLGCTHYPFVMNQIKEITGDGIKIIDPTNAIVSRVRTLITENNFNNYDNIFEIFTSGNKESIKNIVNKLFNSNINIKELFWVNNKLDYKNN